MLNKEMTWEEFIFRYIENNEEFVFKYKNYKIYLQYASNPDYFTYYVTENKNTIFQSIYYRTTRELLDRFLFDGKSFSEIWKFLEWK